MKMNFKRILSWLIAAVLIFSLVPVNAEAVKGNNQLPVMINTDTITVINPAYSDIISEQDLVSPAPGSNYVPNQDEEIIYNTTYEDAADCLRDGMKLRQSSISVPYQTSNFDINVDSPEIFAAALVHTGVPTEGDYLKWVWAGYKCGASGYVSEGVYYLTLTFTLTYHDTAEQEAELDNAVEALLQELNPQGNDYEKLCAVYDYICENITYDYTSSGTLKHTAYAALVNKTAVCQGYAVLLYRLCLEMGIDCRFIGGTGNGGGHGWNIVELYDVYYNVDSTWDATWKQQVGYYNYYLQCEETFTEGGTDHFRDPEYATPEFFATYPMSETDFDPSSIPTEPETSLTALTVGGVDALTTQEGDGWTFSPATDTLTLSSANISSGSDGYAIYAEGDLNLVLQQETSSEIYATASCINVIGNLKISGAGSLAIACSGNKYGTGIRTTGNLTVTDDAKIAFEVPYLGLYSAGSILISSAQVIGQATLDFQSIMSNNVKEIPGGIVAEADVSILDGSQVSVKGCFFGAGSNTGALIVENSSVYAEADIYGLAGVQDSRVVNSDITAASNLDMDTLWSKGYEAFPSGLVFLGNMYAENSDIAVSGYFSGLMCNNKGVLNNCIIHAIGSYYGIGGTEVDFVDCPDIYAVGGIIGINIVILSVNQSNITAEAVWSKEELDAVNCDYAIAIVGSDLPVLTNASITSNHTFHKGYHIGFTNKFLHSLSYDLDGNISRSISISATPGVTQTFSNLSTLRVGGVDALQTPTGDGWSYDLVTDTLTVDNASIFGEKYGIEVKGDLVITGTKDSTNSVSGGAIGIKAEGNLTVTDCNLEISATLDLDACMEAWGQEPYAVYATEGLNFDEGVFLVGGNVTKVGDFFTVANSQGLTVTEIELISSGEIASGVCGDELVWSLTAEGILTVSGMGEMFDFDINAPWKDYREYITGVVIVSGVTRIGDYAFNDCYNLTAISLPDTLISMGEQCLGYTAISEIYIPDSVKNAGPYVFSGCSMLEQVRLSAGLTEIPEGTFYACGKLSKVSVPGSVTRIREMAFMWTESLKDILIPASVQEIAPYAFYEIPCIVLQFEGNAPDMYNNGESFEGSLYGSTVEILYPESDSTWTDAYRSNDFGGNITWTAYTKYEVSTDNHITAAPDEHVTVKVEAEITEFVQVMIDGQVVDPENYTLTEGSTIITFKPEFLATLGEGTYNVTMEFETGLAFTTITLVDEPLPEYSITYTQASISLAGDIGLNYYATLSEDLMADEEAYMIFTVAGEEQIVPISEAIISTGKNGELVYRFSCAVPARMMSEQVVGQMYASDGTAVGEAKAFSVKAYCDKAIAAYGSYASYANLVNLMKAMLNYGGYSQIKFGYNTGNLANADLADTSLPNITGADLAGFAHGKEGTEAGITIQSVSLLLESTTTIRFYFKLDGSKPIESYTFVVDGEVVEPVLYSGTTYYVDKVGVPARELDVNSYVEVGGLRVWYCGMSYVRQILNSSTDTALINACKALYAYSEAANAYFK